MAPPPRPTIRVGLIGTGFIGRAQAIAFRAVGGIFTEGPMPVLEMVSEIDQAAAEKAAANLGFKRATGDWRTLVTDPAVDLVAVATPNHLHKEMALAAIKAGKNVYCEKPLALSAADALEMTTAAEKAGTKTLVGFNYLWSPVVQLAREIIAAGEIGEVVNFRGTHNEDYMADPAVSFSWRCERRLAGAGALGDMGCHLISIARYLVGPITEVSADLSTVITQRKTPDGKMQAVENEDQAHFLARFENGSLGTLETSRIAQGRKMGLYFEVTGKRGGLIVDMERMNELQLYTTDGTTARRGFRTILIGPEHPYFRPFCPAPGHGTGFNDMKTIEVHRLLSGIIGEAPLYPDFREAYRIECVLEAVIRSAAERTWVSIKDR
jgi:predicted dehydrogenase